VSMSLQHIGHPCPATTQNAIEQGQRSAIYGGTKTAVFVSPFEKKLLTWLYSELDFLHSTVHEKCKKLTTSTLMSK
jgi:hypothetical protein